MVISRRKRDRKNLELLKLQEFSVEVSHVDLGLVALDELRNEELLSSERIEEHTVFHTV